MNTPLGLVLLATAVNGPFVTAEANAAAVNV